LRNRLTYHTIPLLNSMSRITSGITPTCAPPGIDAFQHFMETGFREGRNPSPDFDSKFYLTAYMKGLPAENPLLHYIEHKMNLASMVGCPTKSRFPAR